MLFAHEPQVREAINRRGEAWRIRPLPRSPEEMRRLIQTSPVAVRGEPIYCHCAVHGTRILTLAKFAGLARMSNPDLRLHLAEIASLAGNRNACGWPELALFMASGEIRVTDVVPPNLESMNESMLRQRMETFVANWRPRHPLSSTTTTSKTVAGGIKCIAS